MGSPPAQGGLQILGKAEAVRWPLVVDVPVLFSNKFLQSKVGHSCCGTETSTHSANCAEDWRFARCSSWEDVDMPVGVQTTGLWFRQCRKPCWCPGFQRTFLGHFLRADGDSGLGVETRPSLLALLDGEVCAADASVALRGFLVNLDPEVDSVLFSVVVNGAVCTADASVASAHGYLNTLPTSSLYLAVTFSMTGLSCPSWSCCRYSSRTSLWACPSWCNDRRCGPDSAENCLEEFYCCEHAATSSSSPQVQFFARFTCPCGSRQVR